MRTLIKTQIALSVALALGATAATAQTFARPATSGSTVTTTTGASGTAGSGAAVTTNNGATTNGGIGLPRSNEAFQLAPRGGTGSSATTATRPATTDVSTSGNTTTVRTTNADGSSVFVDTTRTLRNGDVADSNAGIFTTRTTAADGSSVFVENTVDNQNNGNVARGSVAPGSTSGISAGQTSSGSAAGGSTGGVFGANASLQQTTNGFGTAGGQSLGQTSSGANVNATSALNTGANTDGVATNGAIIPNGGFLAGLAALPSYSGSSTTTTGMPADAGLSASATDGGSMYASASGMGNLGNGGAAAPRGSTVLDENARREAARTRAKVSRGQQLFYSVTPRTEVDRTWQMPDDYTPLMPR